MTERRLDNLNIESFSVLTTPEVLKATHPITPRAAEAVMAGRSAVKAIIDRRDPRLLVVSGPCSIHDPAAALEYGTRLKGLAQDVADALCLVLRVYFEKPRTAIGWKGLINDPHLDGTFAVEEGLHMARRLLIDLAEMGLPLATEALDPISPQYLQDLISWSAIGARTTESQTHREMSSGLSSAIGFKNGTDGGLTIAINALQSVCREHSFLGIDPDGRAAVVHTSGNAHAHIVLRGGNDTSNYDSVNVALCEQELATAGLRQNIMVDCSHANSNKDPAMQPLVVDDVCAQIVGGNRSIIGIMLESNLEWGNQPIPDDPADLRYGVSVTDACMDWATTERCILGMYDRLKGELAGREPAASARPAT